MQRPGPLRALPWVLFLLLLGGSGAAGATTLPLTVGFAPSPADVLSGETFQIQIVADMPEAILGWGLDLSYDPSVLTLVGDPVIVTPWDPVPTTDGDGLAGGALPAVMGSSVPLAILTFFAEQPGMSLLQLAITDGDLTEGFALTAPGEFVDNVVFLDGVVNVLVPEPTSAALVGAGLLLLAARRRKDA